MKKGTGMKLYKLTNEKDQTYGGCQWGEGVQHKTSGEGPLCGSGWTHWYTHPLLAVLLNPIHRDLDLTKAHLWEGEGTVGAEDHGLKVGCADGKTIRRVDLPTITGQQRVRFGILCAREVYHEKNWIAWSEMWLSGGDRSAAARAAAAAEAARAAAWEAPAATEAARAAAWEAAGAAEAAWAATEAARAAAWAATAAAWEAWAAAEAARAAVLDLVALAKKACNEKDQTYRTPQERT